MKKIGLLGGMSWESTMTYYKLINENIKNILGGLHSAKLVLSSVDFAEIEKLQHQAKWDETAEILSNEAKNVQNAGADFLLICTNTMHKVANKIEENIDIPILHIADATGEVLKNDKVSKVILLGTKFTMSENFYKDRIINNFGIEVITPNESDQEIVHKIIYEELCLGIVKQSSKEKYKTIITKLAKEHKAQGVILGCTEIAMLIKPEDSIINTYDTTLIHALKAVEYSLK